MADIDAIIEEIDNLTVTELVELKDKLQEKYGVTAAAPVAAAAGGGGDEAEAEEEKSVFTVSIEGEGDQKIQVIKAVREVTSLGLKEAKELVESAPGAVVAEDLPRDEADKVKEALENAGAEVKVS
ncbi:MAG: 50S ribosomal protein L7/L12 [Armatimonadota bacterium]